MPHGRKVDLDKIYALLIVVCPHCTARVEPDEQIRVDGETMKCPWCEETFVSKRN
jgi:predicted Zn finger-like uncharacterized protein